MGEISVGSISIPVDVIFVGAALLIVLAVLWLGVKLFFLPLRLVWRLGRDLATQIGVIPLMLVLVWTAAFEPAPFLYLWRWSLRFGQALLSETPRRFANLVNQVHESCIRANYNCAEAANVAGYQLWTTAIGNPIREFEIPPGIASAVLAFAIGMTVAVAARQDLAGNGVLRSGSRTVLALGASFLLALYLSIVAIIAIPIFGERVEDTSSYRSRLAAQLKEAIAAADTKYSIDELDAAKKALPNIDDVDIALRGFAKSAWLVQLGAWEESRGRLASALALQKEAAEFAKHLEGHFQASNEGRVGGIATSRHATMLTNSFQLWLATYRERLEGCFAVLRQDLQSLRQVHSDLLVIKLEPNTVRNALNEVDGAFRNQSRRATCYDDIRPYTKEYILDRSGPVETLGHFGTAAAWLLRTESQELALIVGLLGFGFFGALAASFIKEFAGTPGNELPAVGFILPALVRGVGAAILVFLLAKGGTAILTRGDASPNAYAIFVACFVAAVFSEDVWSWARTRQKRQFDGDNGSDSSKPAAQPTENSANETDRATTDSRPAT